MSSLLLEQTTPDACSAIVLGRANGALSLKSGYDAVLWFVDADGAAATPPGTSAGALSPVILEQTDVSALEPLLESFALRDPRCLPDIFITPDVAGPFHEGYGVIIDAVHDVFESVRRARRTRQEEGFLWQKQLLLNLPDFIQRRVPAAWENALAGVPAVVCGAGPSLDVSAPALAACADRAVVFAADSALRTLARFGVSADFAVSVDAAKPPGKCLPNDCAPARVVLAGISPPAWRDCETEFRLYYLSGHSLTEQMLASVGVAPTPVRVLDNCGITAFELARFLGCAPIHLFGMDLAADASNPSRRHTVDSDVSIDRGSGFAMQKQMPLVPGNYTETVPTFLYGEWRSFNERLRQVPSGLVVNINDRGARLENTRLVHPAELELGSPSPIKRRRLWSLAPPSMLDAVSARAGLAEIGAQGAHGCREIAQLRVDLANGQHAAFIGRMRRLFANENFARAMGTFSLKVMPHLSATAPDRAALDATIVDELEELCCLAEGLYGAAVK